MRILAASALICCLSAGSLLAQELALTPAQTQFQAELANKFGALEKRNATVFNGVDSWLFLASELRFLAQGRFWGDAAVKASRSHKADAADPIPAITDFQRQLRERGIELLLVPVPPKAAVYPEKFSPDVRLAGAPAAPQLARFYEELRQRGVDVLDLTATFAQHRDDPHGPMFCKTDSHWSGAGCVLAAQTIAEHVRQKLKSAPPRCEFASEWKQLSVTGDLVPMLPPDAAKPIPERVDVRTVGDFATGGVVQPDPNSPVLVLGDSHTLVFHDFLGERAGLVDQLAQELGFAPDLIGTRGSGATAVRVSLYRKARSEAGFLAKKKVVVWCFAAREFTEADQGWVPQPIAR